MKPFRPASSAESRAAVSPVTSLPAAFGEQLSALYGLVERSRYVFGSPLGPVLLAERQLNIPRFVYFGPHASDAALRLAFYAGLDHRDLRSTLALLRLVEGLALAPDLGQGLNLSFFPLVDVLGLAGLAPARQLAGENWASPRSPEISLLEQDARHRGYHGFVRLEAGQGDDEVTVRLRATAPAENAAPAIEMISSLDIDPFPVRWESEAGHAGREGPLGIAEDLLLQPFELVVRIPAAWPLELYTHAAASILKRFVLRYRGFIAYGQHL